MGRRFCAWVCVVCAWAAMSGGAFAVETRILRDASFAEFGQGESTGTELLARGRLTPGPPAVRLAQPGEAVAWSVAVDPFDGLVFFSTGHNGRVYGVGADGKAELWADLQEVEALSLAVDPTGGLIIGASPGGKIYRVVEPGKPELLFETAEQHVWSLIFDRDGTLYAGTGPNGRIFRIRGQKNGEVYYDSDTAANVMALGFDSEGRLLAATQGRGYVLRVTGKDTAFVLHAAKEDEVRALATDHEGNIYAAVNGQRVSTVMEQIERDSRTTVTVTNSGGTMRGAVVRIQPGGFAQEFWAAPEGPIQSILADPVRPGIFVAAGRKGRVYRLLSDTNWSLIADVDEPMVLGLASHKDKVYFAAGNKAALYELRVAGAGEGLFASRALDAGSTVRWGNLAWEGEAPEGTSVTVETRTGNTAEPDDRAWSAWQAAEPLADGIARVTNPVAQYLQYRLRMERRNLDTSPHVDAVRFHYVQQNAAPIIREVRVEKGGADQPAVPGGAAGPADAVARALEAVARGGQPGAAPDADGDAAAAARSRIAAAATGRAADAPSGGTAAAKRNSRAYRLTWDARDPNDDRLLYALYLKAEDETVWKLLEDNLEANRAVLTTEDLADGHYRIKVEAGDHRSNDRDNATTASRQSDIFLVDNTPPVVEDFAARRVGDGEWEVTARVVDALSIVSGAEYDIDARNEPRAVAPEDGIFDFSTETFRFRVRPAEKSPEHALMLRVSDREGNSAVARVLLK